jgi:hypothetical protein
MCYTSAPESAKQLVGYDPYAVVPGPSLHLGDRVAYVSGRGNRQLALVTGTPSTVNAPQGPQLTDYAAGSSILSEEDDTVAGMLTRVVVGSEATLFVMSPSGRTYTKQAVPWLGAFTGETPTTGYWETL